MKRVYIKLIRNLNGYKQNMIATIPFAIYLHFPWCIKKCPYCDFNSYTLGSALLPEEQYFAQLCSDLAQNLSLVEQRSVHSIFMGGGTPSLFSAKILEKILVTLARNFSFAKNIEITIEANPGTIDAAKCRDFLHVGINRISLGVQSFQIEKLKALQRVHSEKQACAAIDAVIKAGFKNYNIDLMFGLPGQTIADALYDLRTAINFKPPHLSWYQLTIEPNTKFYFNRPSGLPDDDLLWELQREGQQLLSRAGLQQYEISGYAANGCECQHNLNYWEFGDYLGIGAGAHSKITDATGQVTRLTKIADPKKYLCAINNFITEEKKITGADLFFEFMLNALRLSKVIPLALFKERTMLDIKEFLPQLLQAERCGFLHLTDNELETTAKGKLYLNDLLEMLLP